MYLRIRLISRSKLDINVALLYSSFMVPTWNCNKEKLLIVNFFIALNTCVFEKLGSKEEKDESILYRRRYLHTEKIYDSILVYVHTSDKNKPLQSSFNQLLLPCL